MLLSFSHIDITNFKSFVGEHTFYLDLNYGLHLVRGKNKRHPRLGSNGAGKSSIWGALCWCLWGRTIETLRNPDIEPWYGDAETSVAVHGYKDCKSFRVERQTHPNKLSVNGKSAGQEQVDNLIMPFDLAIHTIILGQGKPLFFDLTPSKKMDLFAEVLDLDRWDKRSDLAKKTVANLERELIGWEGELTGYSRELAQLKVLANVADSNAKEWSKTKLAQIKRLDGELAAWEKEANALETLVNERIAKHDIAVTEARLYRSEVDKAAKKYQEANQAYTSEQAFVTVLQTQIGALEKKLRTMGDSEECPTCGQSIKGTNLEKVKKQIKADIAKGKRVIQDGVPSEFADRLSRAKKAHTLTTTVLRELERKADTLSGNGDIKHLSELKAKIVTHTENRDTLEREGNPYHTQLTSLRKQRSEVMAGQRALSDKITKRKRRIERTAFWIKGFKEIQLAVIDDVLQELDLATNAMLSEAGLVDWSVKYSAFRETKSGTIKHGLNVLIQSPESPKLVRWESWSGGEGQRLRIIGALALSEVLLGHAGVECDLEVLDEPGPAHVSPEGINDICNMLSERAKQHSKVIFFTQQGVVDSSQFASVITVIRGKNGSQVT